MEPYLFHGIVRPERAPLSLDFSLTFSHLGTEVIGEAKVSIVLNQIAVWIESDHDWDKFDLRNVVKTIIQNYLAIFGYLKGFAYDFEVTRVQNKSRNIDYVFGIDIPCLTGRVEESNFQDSLEKLRDITSGENGVYLNRCFNDLIFSMKNADDTGFYCYRAIESLRHHCAAVNNLSDVDESKQWQKFREVCGFSKEAILDIKVLADPLRHGGVSSITSEEREKLLTNTWDVVDGYINGI